MRHDAIVTEKRRPFFVDRMLRQIPLKAAYR